MKKRNIRSLILTIVLLLIVLFLGYFLIAVNITGPYYKSQEKVNDVVALIEEKEKGEQTITRHSFKFITYTSESEDAYRIYDENGKRLLTRKKKDLAFDEVKGIVKKEYPSLQAVPIQIAYGMKNGVYLLENDDQTLLMLDIDTHKKVFYMKEGEQ